MNNNKKKNYINIKNLSLYLNNSKKQILFVQSNYLNQFEVKLFHSLYKDKVIKIFFFKLNLLKRFFNNHTFSSFLNGPTYFLSFDNFNNLNNIFSNLLFKNAFIPLTFLIEKKLYNYNYILNNIIKNKIKNKKKIFKNFLITTNINQKQFIYNNYFSLIQLFSILKLNLKK